MPIRPPERVRRRPVWSRREPDATGRCAQPRPGLQSALWVLSALAGPLVGAMDPGSQSPVSPPDGHRTSQPWPQTLIEEVNPSTERLRLIIETDAGGDPDDEQSLVRFLLYVNEWDVEGIIANRPRARERENRNPERTGLGVVRRLLSAYGECQSNLALHDARFPTLEALWRRTVAGYDDTDEAVDRILTAVDDADPRPLWYSDWGTDHGAATNNLKRALDRVLRERGQEGYARFKSRLRLASYDRFAVHTASLDPPFPLWVDTFRPEVEGKRWYHRFSALTARAGGFDLVRDCLTGHGPLGALYPTNTTHWQKEGDTMTFLYLVPTGMNDPNRPEWGSWAGRYARNPEFAGRPYFWASPADAWNGVTNRDNTLGRWAADLQHDFKARLDWCVKARAEANHPPQPRLALRARAWSLNQGASRPTATIPDPVTPNHDIVEVTIAAGETLEASAARSSDPDEDPLTFQWIAYPEPGTFARVLRTEIQGPAIRVTTPHVSRPETLHFILRVTDAGDPPLSRYARLVLTVVPAEPGS